MRLQRTSPRQDPPLCMDSWRDTACLVSDDGDGDGEGYADEWWGSKSGVGPRDSDQLSQTSKPKSKPRSVKLARNAYPNFKHPAAVPSIRDIQMQSQPAKVPMCTRLERVRDGMKEPCLNLATLELSTPNHPKHKPEDVGLEFRRTPDLPASS